MLSLGYTTAEAESLATACGTHTPSCYSACPGITGICFTVNIPY